MKKIILTILSLFILNTGFSGPVYGLSDPQAMAIQEFLDDACEKSGVPAMSISIVYGHENYYFSSGYGDIDKGLPASENTVYELASVSKAFTGLAMLVLEDQGLLSMEDPVQKYLPWLTMNYKAMPIDMEILTLNKFLYHTSGLTNGRHLQLIPQGNTPDMLEKTVKLLVDTELAFKPGTSYEYGTINYDVLGLVIEKVSGQSYESFMKDQVLIPLGLNNTYLYKEEAKEDGQLAQGYRTSFTITRPYDAPDFAGNKPAGYIMSTTKDMAAWMNIQMGLVDDIPEVFKRIIPKSHKGNTSVQDVNGMYYGAGWSVNEDGTFIEHSGGNPNFSTQVVMFPSEDTGICLLTNSPNTNLGQVENIKAILDGDLNQTYKMSSTQLSDIILTYMTIIFGLIAVVIFIIGLIRKKRGLTKNRGLSGILWLIATLVMVILCFTYPSLIGYDWPSLLVWQTYSLPTGLISFSLLLASITYLKYKA